MRNCAAPVASQTLKVYTPLYKFPDRKFMGTEPTVETSGLKTSTEVTDIASETEVEEQPVLGFVAVTV